MIKKQEEKRRIKQARELSTDSGDGGDDLAELELVEDGSLTGGIEANHEDAHLLFREQTAKELGEGKPHLLRTRKLNY